jgi:hypothetical protein
MRLRSWWRRGAIAGRLAGGFLKPLDLLFGQILPGPELRIGGPARNCPVYDEGLIETVHRLGDVCAKEAKDVDGMVNIVVNAAAKLSKVDTRPLGEFSATV